MNLSILKRSVLAAALFASAACVGRAQIITVDGTLDGAYGAPLTVQTINTSGTDNQNELDAAYAVASGTNLYVFIAGNAHTSGNRMVLFIADGRPGQSTFSYPGALAITHLNGSVFNSDFQATFAMDFNLSSGILALSEFFMANGTTSGGAAGTFSLSAGIGSGAPNNQHFAAPITVALNNNNTAGITASSSGTAASQAAATGVTQGYELAIPLVLLGNPTGGVKVMVFETGSLDNGPIFNQFLPGLPVGTTTFALGGPYTGTTTSLFNFGSRPNEWFPVPVSGVSVALTSPTNNASYIPGSDVVLTANASDLSGSITNVDYYSGSTRLGNATSSPYSFTWAGVPAGSYGLTAVAVNSAGLSATSSVVNITVAWVAPTVSITAPANNAIFTSGATIAISANAAEVSGVITNVAFYANSSLLGNSASAPYGVNWRVLTADTYALTAVASDSRGVSVTSAVVNVAITFFVAYDDASAYGGWTSGANFGFGFQPWILNGAGQYVGFITQTSLHIDTSSKSWGMYANGTGSPYAIAYRGFNNGLATGQTFGVRFQNAYLNQGAMGFCLRSDTNNTSFSDTSIIQDSGTRFAFYTVGGQSDYYIRDGNGTSDTGIAITTTGLTLKLDLLTADTYALTVQTADGATTLATFPSAPLAGAPGSAVQMFAGLNIGTGGNQNAVFNNLQVTIPAPVISLTSPANNANFAPGIGIAITANASEPGGVVTNVAFYADSILIGNAASAPFSFTWSGAPVGTHTLTAVATDTDGYATISLPVTITVGPLISITSPANNTSFTPGSSILIMVNATETGGAITNVAFYSGSTWLGNDTSSPFSFTWTSVPLGNYALTAVATDSAGVSATSAVVNIIVTSSTGSVLRGPMLQGGTATSVYVLAECTKSASDPMTVNYGTTTTYNSSASTAFANTTDLPSYVHVIKLTGLQPNTLYHYQLVGQNLASADYTFRTVAAPGTPFRFAWSCDFRDGPAVHGQISSAILNSHNSPTPPLFSLSTGDYAIDNGYANWINYWLVSQELTLEKSMVSYLAAGNHDGWSGAVQMQAFFKAPDSTGTQGYYSFDCGDLHVTVGNYMYDYSSGSAQYNWIQQDVQASLKAWKIFAAHAPAYTYGGSHGGDSGYQTITSGILEPNGVKAFLAGHNHFYQRNVINGIQHITCGGGGAPLYTVSTGAGTVVSVSDNCYIILDVTPTNLHWTAYNNVGTVLDDSTISKPPAPVNLAATPSSGQVALTWNAVSGATSYTVYYGPTSGGPYPSKQTSSTAGTTVTGLANGTTRYFVVTATDANGPSATSTEVPAVVGNPAPVVTLSSPANGAAFTAPASISLAAAVTANGNTINKVQFYGNTTNLIGEDTTLPYEFVWSNVSAGSYSVTARVVYNGSTTADSSPASITVTNLTPVISSYGKQADGSFSLGGIGAAGQPYVLLGAFELASPMIWTPIVTNPADIVSGVFSLTDPEATNHQQRFYRIGIP